MIVKSESEVAQLCPTLSDPMDCSPPGSSIHGIFQARVLESGAIAFSVLFSTILNSREAFFLLRGDGFSSSNCLKPLANPSFPDVWLIQGFSVFG